MVIWLFDDLMIFGASKTVYNFDNTFIQNFIAACNLRN